MKKKIFFLLLIVVTLFSLAAVLTACNPLKAPQNLKVSGNGFSWTASEGAQGYNVWFGDNEKDAFVVRGTSLVLSDSIVSKAGLRDSQTYTLWVTAVTLDQSGQPDKKSDAARLDFIYVKPAKVSWKVTFDGNYENSQNSTVTVENGNKVSAPKEPTREKYIFGGWFWDKNCLVEAEFDQNNVGFAVTADTVLYAKWTANEQFFTSVFFYNDSWEKVYVQSFKDEDALFEGVGVPMSAVVGKQGWYRTNIDASTTKVVFTNGTDKTEELSFDKSAPYCKDGNWTETLPGSSTSVADLGVAIQINDDKPIKLELNPENDTEYMFVNVDLDIGDKVTVYKNGTKFDKFDQASGFTGTVTEANTYSFYITSSQVRVEIPYKVFLVADGNQEQSKLFVRSDNNKPDGVLSQYRLIVGLTAGSSVSITDSLGAAFTFEDTSVFNGTVAVSGEYKFYAKVYSDKKTVYVEVPTVYTIRVGTDEPTEMILNPENPAEYICEGLQISAGQSVRIYKNGVQISNYKANCGFNGTANTTGRYDFYVDADGIWADKEVFCYVAGLTGLKVYTWKTDSLTGGGWPGKDMYSVAGSDGWFTAKIPAGMAYVIFNNGDGVKTADLSIPTDGKIYFKITGQDANGYTGSWQSTAD